LGEFVGLFVRKLLHGLFRNGPVLTLLQGASADVV